MPVQFANPRFYSGAKWPGAGTHTLIKMDAARLCVLSDVYSNSSEAHCGVYQSGEDWYLSIMTTDPTAYKRCGASCFD